MPLVQEGEKEVVVRDEEEWIQWQESISCSKEPSSTQFLFHTQIRRSRETERERERLCSSVSLVQEEGFWEDSIHFL